MIASRFITACILVLTVALSAIAVKPPGQHQPCTETVRQPGRDHPMNKKSTKYYELHGFTITMIMPGVYDIFAGPTYAGHAVVRVHVTGQGRDETLRIGLQSGATCTARIADPPNGGSMVAFVETY